MKRIIPLLAVLCICSCKKQKAIRQLQKDIAGTWELTKYSGYPFTQPVYPPGNGQIIILDENGSYTRMKHDTLIFSGSYRIEKKKDCYPGENDMAFFTNENNSGTYQYVAIDSGRLSLSTPNCYMDGGTAYYRRIK